jgi:hypothetical protein
MQCFLCDEHAVQACRRCGNVYCDEHGGDVLCQRCADQTLPPSRAYRWSMLALLVGGTFTIWLLLDGGEALDRDAQLGILPRGSITRIATTSTPQR